MISKRHVLWEIIRRFTLFGFAAGMLIGLVIPLFLVLCVVLLSVRSSGSFQPATSNPNLSCFGFCMGWSAAMGAATGIINGISLGGITLRYFYPPRSNSNFEVVFRLSTIVISFAASMALSLLYGVVTLDISFGLMLGIPTGLIAAAASIPASLHIEAWYLSVSRATVIDANA